MHFNYGKCNVVLGPTLITFVVLMYLHFMYRKYCIALVRTQALCHSKAFNCKPGFVRCIENASHLHTNEKILGMSSFKPALLDSQLAPIQMHKNQIQSTRFFPLFLKEYYLINDFTQVSRKRPSNVTCNDNHPDSRKSLAK